MLHNGRGSVTSERKDWTLPHPNPSPNREDFSESFKSFIVRIEIERNSLSFYCFSLRNFLSRTFFPAMIWWKSKTWKGKVENRLEMRSLSRPKTSKNLKQKTKTVWRRQQKALEISYKNQRDSKESKNQLNKIIMQREQRKISRKNHTSNVNSLKGSRILNIYFSSSNRWRDE